MAEKKYGIFIGNTEFPETEGALPPLPSSRNDVIAIQDVLTDPPLGRITDPLALIDLPHHKVMLSINEVFREATRNDEILLYYSGHGQLDVSGALHFATINTNLNLLQTTSIPVDMLASMLRETRCRRIAMIFDCCYSSAIGRLYKDFEDPFNASVGNLKASIPDGYAISIIAASNAISQAYDCDEKALGCLTNGIIKGITSGDADLNNDGLISMDELFSYVEGKMPDTQKPVLFNCGPVETLIVSRSNSGHISPELIEKIKNKLNRFLENKEISNFNYSNAFAILEQNPGDIIACHESSFRLLTSWANDQVSLHNFIEQWYQFNDTGLPETKTEVQTDIKDRWEVVRTCRKPAIDLVSPTYLLDRNFQFLDWNPMFDELVAKPLALMRGRHVEEFILKLNNKRAVIKRGRKIFELDHYPIVDTEILELKTRYGLVSFRKIASQIADEDGGTLAWAINLNILSAENEEEMWKDLTERLEQEVNWSLYAKSYDRMLLNFDSYHQLIEKIVDLLGSEPLSVLDLASGTGNATMEMLRQSTERTIWALESNEDMLEYMREKIHQLDSEKNKQVQIVKGDLLLSLREIDNDSFDGAIMMNALYAMPDRARCLQEIFRVLKPGGVLVYSSSTAETDVERLFSAIRADLDKKGHLDSMRSIVDSAHDRHVQMMDNILKDTHEDVVNYAIHAGFSVEDADVQRGAYEGAVTLVKAVKKIMVQANPVVAEIADQGGDEQGQELKLPSSTDEKVRVFISYAHENQNWCERIKDYLNPHDDIEVWTDQKLEYGDQWHETISEQLEQSDVAILLISTDFLNSAFIKNSELPILLHSAKSRGVLIIPVIIEQCLFEFVSYKYPDPINGPEKLKLVEFQAAGSPTESMAMLKKPQQNLILYEIALRILSLKKK